MRFNTELNWGIHLLKMKALVDASLHVPRLLSYGLLTGMLVLKNHSTNILYTNRHQYVLDAAHPLDSFHIDSILLNSCLTKIK